MPEYLAGRLGSIRPWSELIRMLPVPGICLRPMWPPSGSRSPWMAMSYGRRHPSRGAGSNYKNPAGQEGDLPPDPPPGQAKPVDREGLGRSRGGLSTKVHLVADQRCRPLAVVTTVGQRHDAVAFELLLRKVAVRRPGPGRPRTRPDDVLADKAYSSKAIRGHLAKRGIRAVIPIKDDQAAARKRRGSRGGRPPTFDKDRYRERNTVERAVNKLRATRAVATRYDKRDYIYRGTITVAAIRIWLRDPVVDHLRDTP